MNPVALTARWTAAARARESTRPDRLFHDPFAATLAGDEGFALLDRVDQGENPYLAIRTRFFDDFLLRVTQEHSIGQVVLVGAGMDARAFRLPWPPGTQVYELDQPEMLAAKAAILADAVAQATCQPRPIGVDLEQTWMQILCDAGYDRLSLSVWLIEGFLQYLDETAVHGLLNQVSALTITGSWLGADLLSRELLRSPWTQPRLATLDQMGVPWRFGADDPEGFFAQYGWAAKVTQPGEEGANYGRWSYPVAPRNVPGIPRNFLVQAQRT